MSIIISTIKFIMSIIISTIKFIMSIIISIIIIIIIVSNKGEVCHKYYKYYNTDEKELII